MGNSVSTTVAAQRQSHWRNHLTRQAKSGLSVAAFCRAELIRCARICMMLAIGVVLLLAITYQYREMKL